MELLKLTIVATEFSALQHAIDAVKLSLNVAATKRFEVEQAKNGLSGMKNPPGDATKGRDWERKKRRRQVELRFHTEALEQALEPLVEANKELFNRVERARQVVDAMGRNQWSSLHGSDPNLNDVSDRVTDFRRATLNVLKADEMWSTTAAIIADALESIEGVGGDHCEANQHMWTSQFLSKELYGNRRQFTARFNDLFSGEWLYVQGLHSAATSCAIPSVPCLTQAEAFDVAAQKTLDLSADHPQSVLNVEVYDIITGHTYRTYLRKQ